jgi:hypothetical protein
LDNDPDFPVINFANGFNEFPFLGADRDFQFILIHFPSYLLTCRAKARNPKFAAIKKRRMGGFLLQSIAFQINREKARLY